MKGRLVNIRLDDIERKFFEVAAQKAGIKMTDLIKRAVAAYVHSSDYKDEITREALEQLEKRIPTPTQIEKYREISEAFGTGSRRKAKKRTGC
jgi:hypothetical protein